MNRRATLIDMLAAPFACRHKRRKSDGNYQKVRGDDMMNATRRKALLAVAALPICAEYGGQLSAQDRTDMPGTQLAGSWHVTSGANSVVLSIEPNNEALVIMLEGRALSLDRARWRLLPGGLLVESLPRFRLWEGDNADCLRAEMELPESIDVSKGWHNFPTAFLMMRIRDRQIPKGLRDRPLPAGWEKATRQGKGSRSRCSGTEKETGIQFIRRHAQSSGS